MSKICKKCDVLETNDNNDYCGICANELVADLEAKLSEKEKEISNLRGLVNERDKQIRNLKTNKKRVIEHKNNVKISFAVEKLEKVKELIKNMSIGIGIEIYGTRIKPVEDYIDNQIEEFKKGMK